MKPIYIILLFIHSSLLYAQIAHPLPRNLANQIVIDSGNIKVWYSFNAIDIKDMKTYDDLQCLEIGSKFSKYYSFFIFNSDSLCTDWIITNKNARSIPNWLGGTGKKGNEWSAFYWSDYFKDLSKNILTEYARMPMYIPCFQYSENIPIQNWELHNDTLIVCGYLCQKASCTYRGRHYTAWFALTIPIKDGPWKLGGLPGLILKAYDKDMLYVFECIKIQEYGKKFLIKKYDYKNYAVLERKKLLKLQEDIYKDYNKVAGLIITRGTYPPSISYNPLELE